MEDHGVVRVVHLERPQLHIRNNPSLTAPSEVCLSLSDSPVQQTSTPISTSWTLLISAGRRRMDARIVRGSGTDCSNWTIISRGICALFLKKFIWNQRCNNNRLIYFDFRQWCIRQLRLMKACYKDDQRMEFLNYIEL